MLLTFMHEKDLPKVYGGQLEWVYENAPALDEDAEQEIGLMPEGPVVLGPASATIV